MELYDLPENIFVAQFLGTANVLQGEIRKVDNKTTFEGGKGLKIALPPSDVSGRKSIILRPQNLTLCDPGSDGVDLEGHVFKREFLGNLVRYEIQVGQQRLIVDEVYGLGGKLADRGAKTGLQVDTGCIVVMD